MQFNLVRFEDGKAVVTAFIDGKVLSTTSENGNFNRIVEGLRDGEDVSRLFDMQTYANQQFEEITDRVVVKQGTVYFDDAPVNAAINKVVIGYLSEGEDATGVALFLERLSENPSFNSREQLWRFVEQHGIHLDANGFMVMYKGLNPTDEDDVYQSSSSGTAFVNGIKQIGRIRTKAGDVVVMPRNEISDNPAVACHAGLHAGSKSYATSFAPVLITVRVDPKHVVSVPNDSGDAKVRVERYEIMDVLDREVNTVRWQDNTAWDELLDYDSEDDCMDGICDFCDDWDDDLTY